MKHFKKAPFFYKKPTFLFVSVKRLKLLEKGSVADIMQRGSRIY